MLDFRPLASSSSGCCYLLSGGGASAPLLIDAGVRYPIIQQGLYFQVTQLAGCLVSHAHGDHCAAWRSLAKAAVDIYASVETWERLGEPSFSRQDDANLYRCAPVDRCSRGHVLKPGEERSIGDWRVMPFEVVHDQPGTLGFIVAGPNGGKLLYLTDSAYSPYRFAGLTHIAIEANWSSELLRESHRSGSVHSDRYKRTVRTHMSIGRVIEMLQANDLSQVEEIWLLHLSDENSDEAEFKKLVQQATGKPVYVAAKDGVK